MRFVNRIRELGHLEAEYKDIRAKCIVIYGRRRVGKTRLIEEFLKNKSHAGYYLAAQESDIQQIEEFKSVIYSLIHDEFLRQNKFTDWKHLFTYLEKIWPRETRIVLAIDEVTFIIKSNPSFTSYLQKFWDECLSKTKTILILSGSLVGLMLSEVLGHASPLYGRRTSQIQVETLHFKEMRDFVANRSFKEQLEYYALVGGVPKYVLLISPQETIEQFIMTKCFSPEGFFYQEGLFLVSQEFREPSVYMNILKAIAFGHTKLNEIANFTGIEGKKISSYMDVLIELGFARREVPITEDPARYRGAIYLLADNFLSFWHRFIFPGRSKIELHEEKVLYTEKKKEIAEFIAKKFEEICRQFVRKVYAYERVGKWWGYYRNEVQKRIEIEVDICAIDRKQKKLLVGECKWSDNVKAVSLLSELERKAQYIEWNKSSRKVEYVLFARSFVDKDKLKNRGDVTVFDLEDLEKKWK
ncbi:hypothetical protein A2642_00615 [Candidatus Nomurabacteria bacterium RIFCSPHIGHO2_01_FULL_39_10]|uniref:ATPase n=1 Tax=Candidatus Nomurabacteria bacterium RIFCSPHIGHO2_01_FULL_39_10 TaxID=1801733 RepID=A0A1F6V5W9_9BACT|nr:MAG: hypothetical protein A2642_00615 [Candidatus Nomurabacteria bacterium RIFCSPHIGHO2_01_FULL_39_10]